MIEFSIFASGMAIALVGYDVLSRLKFQKELADTIGKIREAHNAQAIALGNMQDSVNRHEMMMGGKPRPTQLGAVK